MEQEKQKNNRVSRIEEFLLDPEKTLFELLEEFGGSVEEIRNALSQIDVANLETLKGEDGKTPERGVDYFTDEDLDNIEAFILDRIPVVGEDVPSAKQVNEYIDKQVAKIPRVKGDKGNPGTPGKPGKDGSPDSAIDILKKIRSLDKNQGLQLNDIRGLSKKIALLNEVSDEFTQLKEDLNKIKIFSSGGGSDGAGAVASVNGKTGVVVLTQDDIGDGATYVRTENNFTDDLLSKLTGLQTSYSFLNLTDTPSAYTGQQGKFVKVNATADALEFDSIPGGGDVIGPASATDKGVALFDTTTGKLLKNSTSFVQLDNGNVGIGTNAPSAQLHITKDAIMGDASAGNPQLTVYGGSGGGSIIRLHRTGGANTYFDWSLSSGGLMFIQDSRYQALNLYGTPTWSEAYLGQKNRVGSTTILGLVSASTISSAVTDGNSPGLYLQGGLGTGAGESGDVIIKTGTKTTTGTTQHISSNRFIVKRDTGNVGIGTTSPTAVLHLKAGTATSGTAPLKLTSGVVNTTPEAGAIEFDGTDLFITI